MLATVLGIAAASVSLGAMLADIPELLRTQLYLFAALLLLAGTWVLGYKWKKLYQEASDGWTECLTTSKTLLELVERNQALLIAMEQHQAVKRDQRN